MTQSLRRERLEELLTRARGKRIVVIGDAMLDVYLIGDVERISPEAPVPVLRVRQRKSALGGAANVAQNVAAIGADCQLLAVVGNDAAGASLTGMLEEIRAAGALLIVGRCTTQKTRIVARSQQLVRVDEEDDSDLAEHEIAELLERVQHAVEHADALILEDYNKGVLLPSVIQLAMEVAARRGIPSVVDPKYRNFFLYQGATIFKPNRRELEAAMGASVNIADPAALPGMLERTGADHLLLTLGEGGMVLTSRSGAVAKIPTVAREVYDVVGAGDTVTAYLASMLAAGATAEEASTVANIAAGIEVGRLGAVTVPPAELLEYARTHDLLSGAS